MCDDIPLSLGDPSIICLGADKGRNLDSARIFRIQEGIQIDQGSKGVAFAIAMGKMFESG